MMIKSFKHKGLKIFFEENITFEIQDKHRKRLRMQLAALDIATTIDDLNLPAIDFILDVTHERILP